MSLEGTQLGNYRLLRPIGSGSMGEVYLAEDMRIHRQVAIKVIRDEAAPYPDANATKEAGRLFQREMKAISQLDHPNIYPSDATATVGANATATLIAANAANPNPYAPGGGPPCLRPFWFQGIGIQFYFTNAHRTESVQYNCSCGKRECVCHLREWAEDC